MANGSYGPQQGRILRVGDKGDATFVDGGRMQQDSTLAGGLGGAMHRLRLRRARRDDPMQNQTPWERTQVGLDLMPLNEKLYNVGESSEASAYSERLVGVLGDAEHYGSFR